MREDLIILPIFSQTHSGRKTTVPFGWGTLKFDMLKRSKLNSFEMKKLVGKAEVQQR